MVKQINIAVFVLLFFTTNLLGQNYGKGYLVEFADKNNSEFSISQPSEFLSERAIQRRVKWNIDVTEEDLPVNKSYLDSISSYGGIFHVKSKWFNSAVFFTDSSSFVQNIESLAFVKNVTLVYEKLPLVKSLSNKWEINFDDEYYGEALNQIDMCNGQSLHNRGFLGKDIHVAVLDGGFWSVDKLSCFDSLHANNRILGTWDFVNNDSNVYDDSSHGMGVLSIMGAHLPNELLGSAPEASYYLYRTENTSSEYLIEEENWIAGAEKADSAGVDIITASLGYSEYDNDEMSHVYADMDGKTTRITRGAEIAFTKGIFVVNSAGNEGSSGWHYMSAPSDGEHVLCVGAVDEYEMVANFSSRGPSADNRVKPDVMARGVATALINSQGEVTNGNGTSYSCPVMAGFVACLLQALPNYSNQELLDLIRSISDRTDLPDNNYGYGIPDFSKISSLLDSAEYDKTSDDDIVKVYPNPFDNSLWFHLFSRQPQVAEIIICDMQGRIVYTENVDVNQQSYNMIELTDLRILAKGYYLLNVKTETSTLTQKIVRN